LISIFLRIIWLIRNRNEIGLAALSSLDENIINGKNQSFKIHVSGYQGSKLFGAILLLKQKKCTI